MGEQGKEGRGESAQFFRSQLGGLNQTFEIQYQHFQTACDARNEI
jgi:hypothetical protein